MGIGSFVFMGGGGWRGLLALYSWGGGGGGGIASFVFMFTGYSPLAWLWG